MARKSVKKILGTVIVFYILTALLGLGVFGKSGTVYGMNRDKKEESEKESEDKEEDKEDNTSKESYTSELPKIVLEDDTDEEWEDFELEKLYSHAGSGEQSDWSDLYDTIDETDDMISGLYETIGKDDSDSDIISTYQDTESSLTEGAESGDSYDITEEEASSSVITSSSSESSSGNEKYYSFVSNNIDSNLNMRKEAGLEARVVYRIKPGSKGVILETGDEWSKVKVDGYEGFCDNEYLTLKEISKEEYDKEIAGMKKTSSANSGTVSSASAQDASLTQTITLPVLSGTDQMILPAGLSADQTAEMPAQTAAVPATDQAAALAIDQMAAAAAAAALAQDQTAVLTDPSLLQTLQGTGGE